MCKLDTIGFYTNCQNWRMLKNNVYIIIIKLIIYLCQRISDIEICVYYKGFSPTHTSKNNLKKYVYHSTYFQNYKYENKKG